MNPADPMNPDGYAAVLLDPRDAEDAETLERLRADERIAVGDHVAQQRHQLAQLRPAPEQSVLDEPLRWAYYPWRRAVVAVLGPRAFRALRLDRNRNLITAPEQDRLGALRIGVAGLSVGHIVAHTLAAQGLAGELRLADFDTLELSNLNRVPATVFDLGINKAVVAARRIAELDPYLVVGVFDQGLTRDTVDAFVDGLDIVVEECDSLDMKAILREAARSRAIPVVMATSDRGLVDVERFDTEPDRPILHGLLGELDAALLPGMSSRDKIPHILRHLEAERLSSRVAASLVEVDKSISTWPQLASEVNLGATALAEAVRRIGLGEPLASGRTRIDVAAALDQLSEPDMAGGTEPRQDPPEPPAVEPGSVVGVVADAASRAPSGGNMQPWFIETGSDSVDISVNPSLTSALDVNLRGSAVAVGAAAFNARVAAAAHGGVGPVTASEGDELRPLTVRVQLGDDEDPALAALYQPMLQRITNRRPGQPVAVPESTAQALHDVAAAEGAGLRLLTEPAQLRRAAELLGASDRTRYLTPRLHAEMISELRWPGDPEPDTGIDVRSLELDASEAAFLAILRRPDVMSHLARWEVGTALGDFAHDRVASSSALVVVTVTGSQLTDYARGGAAAEAVWIHAEQHGLAVQPMSPVFLYARTASELAGLSEQFGDYLGTLRAEFRDLTGVGPDDELVIVLRCTSAAPPELPSRRSPQRLHAVGART